MFCNDCGAQMGDVPAFLDVNRVTPTQLAGAVSFAMESKRSGSSSG